MTLDDILNKTCLIGLSYFDTNDELLKQTQLSGKVIAVDQENGISIKLDKPEGTETSPSDPNILATDQQKEPVFILPPELTAWFIAPPGHYKNAENGIDIENPDFFVTWDIYKTREDTPEGKHEWWNWQPRTAPPSVN